MAEPDNEANSPEATMEQHTALLTDILKNPWRLVTPPPDFWASQPDANTVSRYYAPRFLQDKFVEFYERMRSALLQGETHTNLSAFLLGPSGSGKTLVCRQCLQALRDEAQSRESPHVHVAHVHGHLVATDEGLVVREILRQLNDTETVGISFLNNIQLLAETFRLARADRTPMVVVLDPIDVFINPQRQLLLYHLLERVADQESSVSLVAMSQNTEIFGQLEKRVRSRAEGSAVRVAFGTIHEETSAMVQELVFQPLLASAPSVHSEKLLKQCQREFETVVEHTQFYGGSGRDVESELLRLLSSYRTCLEHPNLFPAIPTRPNTLLVESLADLSTTHAAVLLAARRIHLRDSKKDSQLASLTAPRILEECRTLYGTSFGRQRPFLARACRDLVDAGYLIPLSKKRKLVYDVESDVPLRSAIHLVRELKVELLDCTTALRQWAKKVA